MPKFLESPSSGEKVSDQARGGDIHRGKVNALLDKYSQLLKEKGAGNDVSQELADIEKQISDLAPFLRHSPSETQAADSEILYQASTEATRHKQDSDFKIENLLDKIAAKTPELVQDKEVGLLQRKINTRWRIVERLKKQIEDMIPNLPTAESEKTQTDLKQTIDQLNTELQEKIDSGFGLKIILEEGIPIMDRAIARLGYLHEVAKGFLPPKI